MTMIENILQEPEFQENGMVWKHIVSGRSDPLVSVRSAVDRMRELHNIEDYQFSTVCTEVLKAVQSKVGGF
jgi:hypothetical protein